MLNNEEAARLRERGRIGPSRSEQFEISQTRSKCHSPPYFPDLDSVLISLCAVLEVSIWGALSVPGGASSDQFSICNCGLYLALASRQNCTFLVPNGPTPPLDSRPALNPRTFRISKNGDNNYFTAGNVPILPTEWDFIRVSSPEMRTKAQCQIIYVRWSV